jgi:hypothetical protein
LGNLCDKNSMGILLGILSLVFGIDRMGFGRNCFV